MKHMCKIKTHFELSSQYELQYKAVYNCVGDSLVVLGTGTGT